MQTKKASFLCLIPLLFLLISLAFNLHYFGDEAAEGANQLSLILAGLLTSFLGVYALKMNYQKIEKKALASIGASLQAIFILLTVGALIAVWILCGIVPTMLYWGLSLLSFTFFLPLCCLICSISSLLTGSSWSTGGTIGVALIGTGGALGIPLEIVAGAVISGAYFGDKLSPLSDTTNLASGISQVALFDHISNMLKTTLPSFILSLILFLIIGLNYQSQMSSADEINQLMLNMQENYTISSWLFLIPLLVILAISQKASALPALWLGVLSASIIALFQVEPQILIETICLGHQSQTGLESVDSLLSRGGMSNMLTTIWLILSATYFGGTLEATGFLTQISYFFLSLVRGAKSLISSTVFCGFLLNLTTSDQYLAIILSAKLFKNAYRDGRYHYRYLSRSVEDSATATSVLIPWNTCGAYFSSVLGVSTLSYLPFCFFNLFSPASSLFASQWVKPLSEKSGQNQGHSIG